MAWAVFHSQWKNKQVNFAKVFTATLIMIGFGLLSTFPAFFKRIGG